MNELQKELTKWLGAVYKELDLNARQECKLLGYTDEDFKSGDIELTHTINKGYKDGLFMVTFGIKKPEQDDIIQVFSAEFEITGYTVYSHRMVDLDVAKSVEAPPLIRKV